MMTTNSSPSASNESPDAASSSFGLLHPAVQRWVYAQGWQSLRQIQEDAIRTVLGSPADVIVAAATAAGKTEAIFLPLCSLLADEPDVSVRVLAVSPLRALINDQARRLEPLAEAIGSRVTPWHGDVTAGVKRRLRTHPAGILLITPESLEALFILHGTELRQIFADLSHVVIDELHAFIGSERGRQLQSLLHRLELILRRRVPRLALSATLGDLELASEFLRPRDAGSVRHIVSDTDGRELRLQLRAYVLEAEPTDGKDGLSSISDHLFATLRGTDNLVFANRRADVEVIADTLRRRSEAERVPNEFLPHHGSLARELRQDVERMLKEPGRPTTAICTSTLELGIDVGSVASIGQVGTPHSVAALRQRLGRSGRRPQDPSILRIHVREPELTARTPPQDELRAELVQSIAVVSLLLDGWCEPPVGEALHLSTLVQQTLSLIAQYGGMRANEAWRILCREGPFKGVDAATFATVLRDLGSHELIQQSGDGALILGVVGERLVDHFSFYVAFSTSIEYRIVANGDMLGSLPVTFPLTVDAHLIFGGRRWRVVAVDEPGRTVHVQAAAGGKAPRFLGAGGLVHDAVRQRMRAVYLESAIPEYLSTTARSLLAEARGAFHHYGLATRSVVPNGDETLLFLWVGDRALAAVLLHLRAQGLSASHDGLALSVHGATTSELMSALRVLLDQPPDPIELAIMAEDKEREKHHHYLSSELLDRDYATSAIDVPAACGAVSAALSLGEPG